MNALLTRLSQASPESERLPSLIEDILATTDIDDPSWASIFEGPPLDLQDDDSDEIVPPRVHDRGAHRLLLAEAHLSCVAVRFGPNQGTAPHSHHPPPGARHWVLVLHGAIETTDSSHRKVVHAKGDGPVEIREGEPQDSTKNSSLHQTRNLHGHTDAVVLHVHTPMTCESCFSCDKVLGMALVPDLVTLADLLCKVIPPTTPSHFHSPSTIGTVRALLESVTLPPQDFEDLRDFCPDRYTRNLVGSNELFTMLVLCWSKGQHSPIHDHTGSSCWVKLLEGELQETRYILPAEDAPAGSQGGGLSVVGVTSLSEGAQTTAYINDSLGLHRMGNPSDTRGCMTLHIYSPPFSTTRIFDAETAEAKQVNIAAPNPKARKF